MELVTLILGAVLVNNIALTSFGGLDVVAVSSKKKINVNTLGLATIVVMTVSGLLNSVVGSLLATTSFAHLSTLVYVTVIVAVSACVENFTSLKLGKFACLVVLNGATLLLATTSAANNLGVLQATLVALGTGVGFYMAMQVYRSLRNRVSDEEVPAAFKGLPVDLLVIAIMAMAVTCFK